MAALSLAAAPPATLEPFGPPRRQEHAAGWLAPSPQRHSTGREGAHLSARRLTVRPRAAAAGAAASELATYQLPQRRDGTTSEWFQAAVRDIVKHVDEAPMLQTVQLGGGGASPRCATYSVHESVVAVPELWHSIAEHVSQHSPDVVLLVQRVRPTDAAQGASQQPQQPQQQQQQGAADGPSTSPPGSPRLRSAGSSELRAHTEEVCRRLVSAGVAEAILLHGQVGDCCDGSGDDGHHDAVGSPSPPAEAAGEAARQQPPPRPLPLPSIVPFSPSPAGATGAARRAVRAAALRPVGEQGSPARGAEGQQQATAYWGVVVQSRRHTGAEGCYLLKTVRSTSAGTGCTCTHFSLTRISQGDHLEQQFVQSWLL